MALQEDSFSKFLVCFAFSCFLWKNMLSDFPVMLLANEACQLENSAVSGSCFLALQEDRLSNKCNMLPGISVRF